MQYAVAAPLYSVLPEASSLLRFNFLSSPRLLFSKDSGGHTVDPNRQHPERRVLIVDDELDLADIFKVAIKRIGCKVDTYNNPTEALAYFEPNQYDLVIFDVIMPNMSGFELFSKIRKIDNNVKVLFVTAFDNFEPEFLVKLPDMDIKCVLKKPIALRQLQDTVKEVLGDKEE
jgi:DNA-binding response OmpR family regulator